MSAFAGIFMREAGTDRSIDEPARALRTALSTSAPGVRFEETQRQNLFVVKFDAQAFAEPAVRFHDEATVSTLAGHPLVESLEGEPRSRHLEFLESAAVRGNFFEFGKTCGSYTFMAASAATGQLILATDVLGTRPLYYADCGAAVYFSSTLATLQALGPPICGPVDERAAVELAILGFPLGNRSGSRNVECLPPGTAVVFDRRAGRSIRYWSFAALRPCEGEPIDTSLREVSSAFESAVRRRISRERVVMAMLSGGMDSRAVVAVLRAGGIGVNSLNFAREGSQDLLYGRRIASALGCNHTEVTIDLGTALDRTKRSLYHWQNSENVRRRPAERPRLIWSGDGGSVTLGHVYMSEEIVSAAASGTEDAAIEQLLWEQRWIVPRGILRSGESSRVSGYPLIGLQEELRQIEWQDAGRRIHMLLMNTDQRRHMHPYYEAIYEHQSDMQLPFFDRKFVEAVVTRPVSMFLNHSFYNKWFALLQSEVNAVPWQVYPGHEPGPFPTETEIGYQWADEFDAMARRQARRRFLRVSRKALLSGAFRGTAVSPMRAGLALIATALRIRDMTYALRFAIALAEPWRH